MKRLALTQHTLRCPKEDCTAMVTARTNETGSPARRHVDIASCSLLAPPSFAAPETWGYFSDAAPLLAYRRTADRGPQHSSTMTCRKRCLATLNAAELGAVEPIQCTSGVSDGLELARQTQTPAMMRLLWFYSV